MLTKCKFGGGHSCRNQGGDGSNFHKSFYVHPHVSVSEVGKVADGFISKSVSTVVPLFELEEGFDDDFAKSFLSTEITQVLSADEIIRKALYDIDVNSEEGITQVLSLLPILDPEILKLIYQECFPGYSPENLSPRMMRIELRGYLMDMLEETILYGETEDIEPAGPEEGGPTEIVAGTPAENGDVNEAQAGAGGNNAPTD